MKTMRIFPWLLAIPLLCGPLSTIAATKTQDLSHPTELQGVPCQGKVEFHDDGRIHHCHLSGDYTIQGNVLPAGSELRFNKPGEGWWCRLARAATFSGLAFPPHGEVCFHENGEVASCRLSRDSAFLGSVLPAGSTIFLPRKSMVHAFRDIGWGGPSCPRVWLPADTRLQGHLCEATMNGVGHILYPDGKLRGIWLAHDEEIDGVPCTSSFKLFRMPWPKLTFGTDFMAWFYENGHLQQGMVSRQVTLQGRSFKAGDIISLTPAGRLQTTTKTLGAASHGPVMPPWWPR